MKDWKGSDEIRRGMRRAHHQQLRRELRNTLLCYDFTYFITLASNYQPV